uniref:acyltransferase domain-containing protein n=1 Tax=Streptomyces phytophilus TaxID=722715 RepID=UPI0015F06A4A
RLLERTGYTQPALFALEVALYRLLEHTGIRPDYLAGHSLGQITAAHCAGVLTLDDAALLVTTRARLMQNLPPGGAMTTAHTTPDTLTELLAQHPDVAIAAHNAPTTVTLSGPQPAITAIEEALRTQGIRVRRLHVSHAFHSPLMNPVLDDFHRTAESLTYHPPTIPIISNHNGQLATT